MELHSTWTAFQLEVILYSQKNIEGSIAIKAEKLLFSAEVDENLRDVIAFIVEKAPLLVPLSSFNLKIPFLSESHSCNETSLRK